MSSKAAAIIQFLTLIILICILYVAGFTSTKQQQEINKLKTRVQQLSKQNENIALQSDEKINKLTAELTAAKSKEDSSAKELVDLSKKHKDEIITLNEKITTISKEKAVIELELKELRKTKQSSIKSTIKKKIK